MLLVAFISLVYPTLANEGVDGSAGLLIGKYIPQGGCQSGDLVHYVVCSVHHFVDDCLTLVLIDEIEVGSIERNVVGYVVDAGGVGGIVVCLVCANV